MTENAHEREQVARLALHVDQNDPSVMKLALNNATNVYNHYRGRGQEVAIEIVANSGGYTCCGLTVNIISTLM